MSAMICAHLHYFLIVSICPEKATVFIAAQGKRTNHPIAQMPIAGTDTARPTVHAGMKF